MNKSTLGVEPGARSSFVPGFIDFLGRMTFEEKARQGLPVLPFNLKVLSDYVDNTEQQRYELFSVEPRVMLDIGFIYAHQILLESIKKASQESEKRLRENAELKSSERTWVAAFLAGRDGKKMR